MSGDATTRPDVPALVMPQDEFELVKDLRQRISAAIEAAWWTRSPASAAVMEIVGPLIDRAEAAEAKVAALEAALRRHLPSFIDPNNGEAVCGGCLEPSPCPDAGLLSEEKP